MGGLWKQFFPPAPTFTERDVPSLTGKVFIVTGGNSGVGLELVKILYAAGGTVYIASRSLKLVTEAISEIQSIYPKSTGTLKSLRLDLADLSTIGPCASSFLAQESRLDVLYNNAGVASCPGGSVTPHGHEKHMGTNCIGPFLLTKLLLPILTHTGASAPKGSVRVVFASSGIIDLVKLPGGLLMSELVPGQYGQDQHRNYSSSKAGNWFLASELDRRVRDKNVLCLAEHPGTLKTKGWHKAPLTMKAAMYFFIHEPKMGALTMLWTGLSPEVKMEDGGRFAMPWGNWHSNPRKDVLESLKRREEGGTGLASNFWDWCEEQTKDFV
jgi:NAD(P)-dependent dehydrogenase (short-subunit alcohol dehydrogenase family)